MLIETLKIQNFRQFCGSTTIEFAHGTGRNLTVIHGANGSGKTSILNAFKWCFYGLTDFDTGTEHIANLRSIEAADVGEEVNVAVTVRFSHELNTYTASRTARYQKNSDGEKDKKAEEFVLDVLREDGQTIRSGTPAATIKGIIPEDLQPYFFFNGERIEHIASVNASTSVREAIRKLMGVELVERVSLRMRALKNQYRRTVSEDLPETQRDLYEHLANLEDQFDELKNKVSELDSERKRLKTSRSIKGKELARFDGVRDLQEQRDTLEQEIIEFDSRLAAVTESRKTQIAQNAFKLVSEDLFRTTKQIVDENRNKGVLPYGIRRQFIQDRIAMGKCICGTEICENEAIHKALLALLDEAGTETQESAYNGVYALINNAEEDNSRFWPLYRDYVAQAASQKDLKAKNLSILEEISAQIKGREEKSIVELENELKLIDAQLDQLSEERGVKANKLRDLDSDIGSTKKELKRIDGAAGASNTSKLRMEKAEKFEEILTELIESLTHQVRYDLSRRINETFQKIIRKPVQAGIDDDFSLIVKRTDGDNREELEQSTGERQVTSLSFIASIIALAKDKHHNKSQYFNGGLYPLVMDSPYGALDPDYRRKVAEYIPNLAEQVIVLVSDSQWNGEVAEACEERVGREYHLRYEQKPAGEADYWLEDVTA